MGMDRGRMLRGVVLRVWVRWVLVQWRGRTMVPGARECRAGKHRQQQRDGKQLLHATNLA